MPTYRLRIINEHFDHSVDLESQDLAGARKKAVASAISIAGDLICDEAPLFGAELILSHGNATMSRHVITVGVAHLKH